jgi:hypothetical protein
LAQKEEKLRLFTEVLIEYSNGMQMEIILILQTPP